ncbi:MAG: peptide ABC transporter substrate-binding protein [Trueperaceae bacterium]|nr:peptide ABC transporter substrate-binding protein [Trueperaceae bacterium]
MKFLRTIILIVGLLALMGTSLAQRGRDGNLDLLYWQAVSILNPYLSGGTKDIYGSSIVLEPLARYAPDGSFVPFLAAEIPTVENGGIAEDLTSITWKLRDDVVWSDGTPFTAADVVFTGEYCMNDEAGCTARNFFNDIESIEALDDHTVHITFSVPKPFPYSAFVSAESPILQRAQFADCIGVRAQACSAQNFGPIGTGPFVVRDFRPNDVVTYEANELFREADKPAFQTVTLKGGGDAASAARAVLETGEADWAWNLQVDPVVLAQMEAAGIGQLTSSFGTSVERILVNFTNVDASLGNDRGEYMDGNNPHPILADLRVRQALSMAIDREILVEIGYGPTGTTTCNIIPAPEIYASSANDDCLMQDVEGANALLDEAGWERGADGVRVKDGRRFSLLYQTSTNAVRQDFQALIKEWWEELGVEVELRNIDAGVFFGNDPSSPDTYGKFWADVQMFTSSAAGTDVEAYANRWTCGEISGRQNQWLGNNQHRWCESEYDALSDQLAQTVDIDERAELIKAMNDMLVQDVAVMPLVHRADVSARANSLMGTQKQSWDSELWNIADWYRGQ